MINNKEPNWTVDAIGSLHKWVAEITYHTEDGFTVHTVTMAELGDLEQIVESGPDFFTTMSIEIRLNGVTKVSNKYAR